MHIIIQLEEEKWRPIKGYEGLYEISNYGSVKSFKKYPEGKIMKPKKDKDGYLHLGIRDSNRKRKFYRIHRLVAEAFIINPKPELYDIVNHKDNDVSNNYVTNLEWCDTTYNNKHRFSHGNASLKGENHSQALLTEEQALEIYKLSWNGTLSQPEIGRMFGVSRGAVSSIKYGDTWTHVTGHKITI